MPGELRLLTLTDVESFADVEDGWRRLAVGAGNLFLTPEWARSWLEEYGDRFAPSIRVAADADGVVGVLPLMRESDGTLRFAGDGSGDFFEPLVDASTPAAEALLLGSLVPDRNYLLVLTNVLQGAAWRRRVLADASLRELVDRPQTLPFLDLSGSDWKGYLAGRSANFRSQLGRKRRSLEKAHELRLRRASGADEVAADFETFLRLHDERWDVRGGSSSASPKVRSFLRRVALRADEQGWLRLWTMELDGVPAATWLGWSLGGRYSYYLAGFDPAFASSSPGLVMLAHTIEDAFGEDATVYDFLLGDESYKARFASGAREVETTMIGTRWQRRLLLGRVDRRLRRAGRALPDPVRHRVKRAARAVEHHLPLSRHR